MKSHIAQAALAAIEDRSPTATSPATDLPAAQQLAATATARTVAPSVLASLSRTPLARQTLAGLAVCLGLSAPWGAAQAEEPARRAIVKAPIPHDRAKSVSGTLFISGGGRMPESSMQRFIDFGGGEDCRLVIITTASEAADTPDVESRVAPFRSLRVADLCVVHTRDRDVANSHEFCIPLENATAVWFIGGHQSRLTDVYLDTRVERCLRQLLDRGGVIGGTSAGAAIMSQVMIKGGNPEPELERGLGFLPGTVVDQHFLKRRRQDRLLNALSAFPHLVGVGIDEGTSVVVQGRRMTVLEESDSEVVTFLAETPGRPVQQATLRPGDQVDLLALSRSAAARVSPKVSPSNTIRGQGLLSGSVMLAGGGPVPQEAAERFIASAGGPESLIVVVTTAAGETLPDAAETTAWLRSAGARNVVCVHPQDNCEAEAAELLELLAGAGGIWFTGGRQWRLVDALEGTQFCDRLQQLLARDGVIGGNAAGASILASYLVRGNPLDNRQIMGEGYEDGFGLLPGTAVDPYFSQRHRLNDMARLKLARPELLGLGIDEGTAVLIRGRELEVLGENRVSIFDQLAEGTESPGNFLSLGAGDQFDLIDMAQIEREDSPRVEPQSFSAAFDAEDAVEATGPLLCE
jgi:cyanophycinase